MSWTIGFITGFMVCGAIFGWKFGGEDAECRKQHNVYRCEMTWLPAAQEN